MLTLAGVFWGVVPASGGCRPAELDARGVVASVAASMTRLAGDDMGLSNTSFKFGPDPAGAAGTGLKPAGRQDESLAGTDENGRGCGWLARGVDVVDVGVCGAGMDRLPAILPGLLGRQ